jgi:hypothetical protein
LFFFEDFFIFIVVRTTRADPRHHRKHVHHRHQQFDDADERSYKDNSNSSPIVNGENKSTAPMIDVNLITDLLIQHSQTTGFEKSLEMLTQTLRQLTDPNVVSTIPTTATSSQPSSQISQSNTFENLLMKRLQPPVLPPPVGPQVWFNPTNPQTFSSSVPPYYPPSGQRPPPNASVDFHSQQQYQNQRN